MTDGAPRSPSSAVGWLALAGLVLLAIAVTLLVLRGGDLTDLATPPEPTETPEAATPTPTPAPPVDAQALDAQVRAIAETVERMRDLSFERLPSPRFMTEDQIVERVDDLLEEYTEEDADLDRRLLVALGAMEPEQDLRELYRSALSEEVAGLYDPDTGELVVVTRPSADRLGPLAQMTLVHELGHALLDQVIGLPDVQEIEEDAQEDAALASQAVVEGDATLLMLLYAQREMTSAEQLELLEEQQDAATGLGALDDLPHFVRRQLMFPYEEGLAFVAEIQQRGGWEVVNGAFEQPPTTTLDVLDPDRFLAGPTEAAPVPPPQDPGGSWTHETSRSFGAAHLLFLFEAPGGDETAAIEGSRARAQLWRGGQAELWTDGDATAVTLALTGADGLCDAVAEWYGAAAPDAEVSSDEGGTSYVADDRSAHITCAGDDVRVGIGPEIETARTLSG